MMYCVMKIQHLQQTLNINKYEDTSLKDLLYTTSFLDPRFKAEYIPNGNMLAIKEGIS